MAFPTTALLVTVEAAFGADLTADPSTWTWTDITTHVRKVNEIQIEHGRKNEGDETSPASVEFELNNPSGRYTPGMPTSPYYPYIRQSTPVRLKVNPGSGAQVRFAGFVDVWLPSWDAALRAPIVTVTASGLLRRLEESELPLQSPLYRTISRDSSLLGYWPCEDGSSSGSAAEAFGRTAITWSGTAPNLGNGGPPGSDGALTMSSGTELLAPIPLGRQKTDWSAQLCVNIPAAPSGASQILRVYTPGSTYTYWALTLFPAGGTDTFGIEVFDVNGVRQVDFETNFDLTGIGEPYGRDLMLTMSVRQNGAAVEYEFGMYEAALDVSTGRAGGSFAGTSRYPQSLEVPGFYDHSTGGGWEYSHISLWEKSLDASWGSLVFSHTSALGGYNGELAGVRLARLCSEEGVAFTGSASTATGTAAMGPQTAKTLVDLLRECESVDGGILYDGMAHNLAYLAVADRYNLTAALTANFAAQQVNPPFQPASDDQGRRNDVTASRSGGSSAQFVDEQDVADHGRYSTSVTLNTVDDSTLTSQAAWRVHLGTGNELRYPALTLNLARASGLVTSWLGLEIGDRITVTNPPAEHPPGSIDLVVEGWTETIKAPRGWQVEINCSPYRPWEIDLVADSRLGRVDTGGSMLNSDATSSATSLKVATTVLPAWTTIAADIPFDVDIGGEQITVTAVASATPSFVAAGTAAHADNASVSPGLPAGLTTGDLLLVWAAIRSSGTGVVSTPSGYTRLWPDPDDPTLNVGLFAKMASASESAPTVSFTGGSSGDTTSAQCAAFRNVGQTVAYSAGQLNGSAANIAYPALVINRDNCAVLYLGWKQDDWTSVATVAGATEIGEPFSTTGNDQGIVWDYVLQTTAANIASGSFTVTGGLSAISRGAVVALASDVQTFTVTRGVNGVSKAQTAQTPVNVWRSGAVAL